MSDDSMLIGSLVTGVAYPQVVDRGNSLQLWRVPANILIKQSHTAERGVVLHLGGVGCGSNNPSP
jgi:hypothetical protein